MRGPPGFHTNPYLGYRFWEWVILDAGFGIRVIWDIGSRIGVIWDIGVGTVVIWDYRFWDWCYLGCWFWDLGLFGIYVLGFVIHSLTWNEIPIFMRQLQVGLQGDNYYTQFFCEAKQSAKSKIWKPKIDPNYLKLGNPEL